MLRTPNKPLKKNNRIVYIYLFFFFTTLAMNVLISIANSQPITLMIILVFLATDLLVFLSVWLSNSSYIEPNRQVKFYSLMETFDPETLCPFCQVIRLPQSRHCNICNRCVERYDHHCPWINNCVGRTNHSRFYAHLILILAYCIASIINAVISLLRAGSDDSKIGGSGGVHSASKFADQVKISPVLVSISNVLLMGLGILFGTLVTALFVYQT